MSLNKTLALSTAKQYLLQKKLQAAIDIYRDIIEADPSDLSAINTLGDLYVSMGRLQEAMERFSQLVDAYLEANLPRSAVAVLKKMVALDAENSETAIKLADTYLRAGMPIEARQSYLQIADRYTRRGETLDALRVYGQIVHLDPSDTSLRLKVGELYLREGMSEQAYEAFLTAARQLEAKGEIKRSINAYNEALAVRPSGVEALTGVRKLNGSPGTAANERLPAIPPTKVLTTNADGENASAKGALPARTSHSSSHPPNEPSLSAFVVKEISRAEILVAYGDVGQAISMLGDVLIKEPDNVAVHIKLTDIYLRTGMMADAALQCLKLAQIHEERGERDRARDYRVRASRLAQLKERSSGELEESGATQAERAEVRTNSSRSSPESPHELLAKPLQLMRTVEPPQLERSQPKVRAISKNETTFLSLAEHREGLPLVPPTTLIQHEMPVSQPVQVELVSEPREELAIAVASHNRLTSPRSLEALVAARASSEKKRVRFYATLSIIASIVLATGALIGRSAYESHLDRQYQELTSNALIAPSSTLPSATEDSESVAEEGPIVVAVTPSPQPEAARRSEKPEEPTVTENEQPVSPQSFNNSPRATNAPPQPLPPRIAINSDGRSMPENTAPQGVPTFVPTGAPSAAPAPVEPSPRVVEKAPAIVRGGVVKRVQPPYPAAARSARVTGVVTVEMSINEQGDVTSARAVSGPPLLRNAAVSAAYGWKFKPSTRGGVPVRTTSVIAFDFSL